jgi:hypothetical protein
VTQQYQGADHLAKELRVDVRRLLDDDDIGVGATET